MQVKKKDKLSYFCQLLLRFPLCSEPQMLCLYIIQHLYDQSVKSHTHIRLFYTFYNNNIKNCTINKINLTIFCSYLLEKTATFFKTHNIFSDFQSIKRSWDKCAHVCFTASHSGDSGELGSALGPDWHEGIELKGAEQVCINVCICTLATLKCWKWSCHLIVLFISQSSSGVHLEYECEVDEIFTQQEFLQSKLSTKKSELGYIKNNHSVKQKCNASVLQLTK